MPCIKSKGGWRIRRSAGGIYPKVYTNLAACKKRVVQMETFKHLRGKGKMSKRSRKAMIKAKFK